jgi:hypothetical protein
MTARPPGTKPKNRRSFRIEIRWQNRRFGPQKEALTVEATHIRRAINSALKLFFRRLATPLGKARPARSAYNEIEIRATRRPQERTP